MGMGSFDISDEVQQGVEQLFWSLMSKFSTFCFITASVVLFLEQICLHISQIIWQSYFGAILMSKRHNKHIFKIAEKYHTQIQNQSPEKFMAPQSRAGREFLKFLSVLRKAQ